MGLLRAELAKLTTVRTTWAVTVVGAVLVGVQAAVYTFVTELAGPFTGEVSQVARAVSSIGANSAIVLVVGLLSVTTEFRFGTIGRTLQLTPSRTRVMVAKLTSSGIYAIAFAAVALLPVALVLGIAAATNGVGLAFGGEVVTALGEATAGLVMVALLGVAVGALLRNQVLAVVVSLVWVFVLEGLVVWLLPVVGRWLPFQALQSVFVDNSSMEGAEGMFGPMVEPLEPAVALSMFLAYVLVLTVTATVVMRTRDV